MGSITEACIICKKKDYEEKKISLNRPSRTTQQIIIDKYCEGKIQTITYEEKEVKEVPIKRKNTNSKKLLKSSIFLYTNQFYSNPMDSYKIVEDINENLKVVHLLSNTINLRMMKIIDGGEDFNDKEKKTFFYKK